MDVYEQIAVKIIQGQEAIIGPVALEQAEQVAHLGLKWSDHQVSIQGEDKIAVIDDLIDKYKDLFGHISVEVSKEAAGSLMLQLPPCSVPEAFK